MNSKMIVPFFTSDKLAETRDFYRDHLGFTVAMDSDMALCVSLGEDGPRLGFMPPDENTPLSSGAGLLYCLAVKDIEAEYKKLEAAGAPLGGPPEDMPWGDRRFTLTDPNGITVYVGQESYEAVDCAAEMG